MPLPADAERVEQALLSLRGAAALAGGRGHQAVDTQAAARLAAALGSLLLESGLDLLELNPVVVHAEGCVALDALGRESRPGPRPGRDAAIVAEAGASPNTTATVRAHLARIERGEIDAAVSNYAEDAVLEAAEVGEARSVLTGTFQGSQAIGRWMDGWFSSFEPGSYRFKVEQSTENGDRVYLALSHTARGVASGVEVSNHLHHVFTVRDGLIVRHAFSTLREPMLRQAGIEPR